MYVLPKVRDFGAENALGAERHLGTVYIPFAAQHRYYRDDEWYPLGRVDAKNDVTGEIHLGVREPQAGSW